MKNLQIWLKTSQIQYTPKYKIAQKWQKVRVEQTILGQMLTEQKYLSSVSVRESRLHIDFNLYNLRDNSYEHL